MIHCLHGAVGSHLNWHHLQSALPNQIHPVDLWRLFDKASPTLPEAGQGIADQARQNDLLLGYSMGGRLALHALLAAPSKWRGAILISTHPGLSEDHQARLTHDQKWALLAQTSWQDFLAAWNAQPILSGTLDGLHHPSSTEALAVAQSFHSWSLGNQSDLHPRLSEITCPVLWLTGENDPKFTHLAAEAVPQMPNAQHQTLPSCGHRLPWENPQLFLDHVEKFLAITRKEPNLHP